MQLRIVKRGLTRRRAVRFLVAVAAVFTLSASPAGAAFVPAVGSPFPTAGVDARAVALGDFNEDGNLDAVTANQSAATVSVLLGDGTGRLNPAPGSPLSVAGLPLSVVVGDVNGDGNLDAVVGGGMPATVLLGDGGGGLSALPPATPFPTPSVALGDFNGDTKLDIAGGSRTGDTTDLLVVLGDGLGGFVLAPGSPMSAGLPTGSNPNPTVVVGDVNGDGSLDIAATFAGGTPEISLGSVLLGDGSGRFSLATGSPFATGGRLPYASALGGLDSDSTLDMLVAHWEPATFSVLLGIGDGNFSHAPGSPFPDIFDFTQPISVALGDFDRDSNSDFAAAGFNGYVSVFLGDGEGRFSAAAGTPLTPGGVPHSVAIGDLNGDEWPDIAVADWDRVWVYLNDFGPTPPQRSDFQNASRFCKAERDFFGDQAFAEKYGANGADAYGRCVHQNR